MPNRTATNSVTSSGLALTDAGCKQEAYIAHHAIGQNMAALSLFSHIGPLHMFPVRAADDLVDHFHANPKFIGKRLAVFAGGNTPKNLRDPIFGQFRRACIASDVASVQAGQVRMGDVFGSCNPLKVCKPVVRLFAILVVYLVRVGRAAESKRLKNKPMHYERALPPVGGGQSDHQVAPSGKHGREDSIFTTTGATGYAFDTTEIAGGIAVLPARNFLSSFFHDYSMSVGRWD